MRDGATIAPFLSQSAIASTSLPQRPAVEIFGGIPGQNHFNEPEGIERDIATAHSADQRQRASRPQRIHIRCEPSAGDGIEKPVDGLRSERAVRDILRRHDFDRAERTHIIGVLRP